MRQHRMMTAGAIAIFLCFTTDLRAQEAWERDFEEAAALAEAGRVEEALPVLGKAIRAGLEDVSILLSDPRLESLKDSAAFRRVIREMAREAPLLIAGPDEPGSRLVIRGQLMASKGKKAKGAFVHVFHADASSEYTRDDPTDVANSRIFGYLRADQDGRFEIHTVHPGLSPEREKEEGPARYVPEIVHFEVTVYSGQVYRFQMLFDDSPRMTHTYWREWADDRNYPVANVRRDAELELAFFVLQLDQIVE